MGEFTVHELPDEVRVRVTRAMPALPADLDAQVEALYRTAAERVAAGGAGKLFNGQVFSIDAITPSEIVGHMTEFRRIVAQMEAPALFPRLGIRPMSVCGVLRCTDGVVIGRRPRASVYQPDMWQLPPAGSVDANALRSDGSLDLAGQLLIELQEEIGLGPDEVDAPRPLCLIEHAGSHVTDFGMALLTPLTATAVLAAHRANGNTEYDPLIVVPYRELETFVISAGNALVPPAREFLRRLGLMRHGLASAPGS